MRIGFLCAHNPHDRNSFSGTAYYACAALQALQRDGRLDEMRILGSHHDPRGPRGLAARIMRRLGRPAPKLRYGSEADLGAGLDWIVSLVSGDQGLALRAPLVHVTDATPNFLRDFYGKPITPADHDREAETIRQAARIVYSSDFIRDRAIADFGPEASSRMRVIPFGVNLDDLPGEAAPGHRIAATGPVNLLFIGKDWQRKGGEIALAAQQALRAEGRDMRLTIVGCDPRTARGRPGVTIWPYLDKNRRRDAARFAEILRRTHLFVLPTRADCTPMVIAEANAYSIPVLVTRTGGIPTLVAPEGNGRMLPPEAGVAEWAAAIGAMLADDRAYAALRQGAYRQYATRLNWHSWAEALVADLSGQPQVPA